MDEAEVGSEKVPKNPIGGQRLMSNGELFGQVRAILEGNKDIPAHVQNSLILAAIIEQFKELKDAREERIRLDGRVTELEKQAEARRQRSQWSRDKLLAPIVTGAASGVVVAVILLLLGV